MWLLAALPAWLRCWQRETHKQVVSIKPVFAATVLWAATQSSSTHEDYYYYYYYYASTWYWN